MRVAILTWEFPPRIVGEMAFHVSNLAVGLTRRKVDVFVVTYHDSRPSFQVNAYGVKVFRVSNPVSAHSSILTWALTLTAEFERVGADLYYSTKGGVDVVDAYEWLCVPAAVGLKRGLNIPFVFTVHSLEDHRSRGASHPLNLGIKSLENLGCHESERIIVESKLMKEEVKQVYRVPDAKVDVAEPNSPTWIDKVLHAYRAVVEAHSSKALDRNDLIEASSWGEV